MSVYDDERPASPLPLPDDELHMLEDAHVACRSAWLYPLDDEIRDVAQFAVARVPPHYDYLKLLAGTLEGGGHPDGTPFTVEEARRAVAETFRKLADESYAEHGYQSPARRLMSDPDEVSDPFDPRRDGLDAIGGP